MPSRPTAVRRLGLALLWVATAAALVLGLAALGAGLALAGGVGEPERAVWRGLARAIGLGALAPLGAWTVAAWGVLAGWRPGLDASWRSLAPGVLVVAALGFPPVGAWCFTAWTPRSALDYVGTLALVAGGVAAALLLARRLWPPLAPGALGAGRSPETAPEASSPASGALTGGLHEAERGPDTTRRG